MDVRIPRLYRLSTSGFYSLLTSNVILRETKVAALLIEAFIYQMNAFTI